MRSVTGKPVRSGIVGTCSGCANLRLSLLAGFCLLLFTAQVLATTQAQQYFDRAMDAFRKSDYSQALDGFSAAVAAGLDTPAVYYNLAVCYYRTGAYAQAQQNFLKTARFADMAALAYYNLGLVSIKQQDRAAALSWLNKSRQASTDAKLDRLVAAVLEQLEGDDVSSRVDHQATAAQWSGVIFAGLGHDDNVTLDNSDLVLVSRQSATVAELFVNTKGILSGSEKNGFLFRGSLYADMNDGHNNINIAALDGGLYLARRTGIWSNEYGFSLSRLTLGGDDYLDKAGLGLSTSSRLSETFRLDMRLRARVIRSRNVLYDPLEGRSQDIRVSGKWSPDDFHDIKLQYQLYNNDRNDLETATRYSSFSYIRHKFRAEYKYRITPRYGIRLAAGYRQSDYKDDNIEAGNVRVRRRDDRARYLLGLDYHWSRETLVGLKYEHVNNDSNIDRFDYASNRLLASWTALY